MNRRLFTFSLPAIPFLFKKQLDKKAPVQTQWVDVSDTPLATYFRSLRAEPEDWRRRHIKTPIVSSAEKYDGQWRRIDASGVWNAWRIAEMMRYEVMRLAKHDKAAYRIGITVDSRAAGGMSYPCDDIMVVLPPECEQALADAMYTVTGDVKQCRSVADLRT